jgi:undecaprenyl-diphosphatase
MGILEAIILGIIQGLTEFLPVSSSGHLEIAKAIFGNEQEDGGILMTVTLHAATALSTIVVFRKDIGVILKGLFAFKQNEELLFSLKIIVSMIPAAFIGLFFEDQIDALFDSNILLVGLMLLVTGLLLFLADKAKNTDKKAGFKEALIIGVSQAIAILPGISRSGATISTSVLLGVDRERAARFSFLMVVPLILGKMAKDLMDGEFSGDSVELMPLGIGFIAAFITGLVACTWMISLVKKSKLSWFSIYCFLIGTIAIIWALA